jgi:hypothetical protein
MLLRSIVMAGLLAVAGCETHDLRVTRVPGLSAVVDSAVPMDDALRRFREVLPEVTRLGGGEASRERLVRAFVRALGARDTAALRAMVLSRAEFAWLYYPTAREANPPYNLPPDLMWFTQQGRSERGIGTALETLGGHPIRYLGHDCAPEPRIEGENRLWGFCVVRYLNEGGESLRQQVFGLIIERGGVYKFVSYANKLD